MFVPICGPRGGPALIFFFFLVDEGRKGAVWKAPNTTIRGVHLSHFRNFLRIGFQKMLIMFLPIERQFPKYSINFANLSSDLNMFYTVVNLNV